MKKIVLTFFSLIFLTSSVFADPKDYPPTAFQLAQIHHYVKNEALVKKAVYLSYDRTALKHATHAAAKLDPKLSDFPTAPRYQILSDAEALIASHISDPLKADEAEWGKFYDAMLPAIKSYPRGEGLVESFEENAKPVIIKAIMLEQEAMQKDEVVLWRAGRRTAEFYRERDDYNSFSLGLFSGFLFDGFKYQNCGLITGIGSACTYTYLSTYLYVTRLIGEVESGEFYAKTRTTFPEFFEAKKDEWPEAYRPDMSIANLFSSLEGYYILDLQVARDAFYAKYNPLNAVKRLVMDPHFGPKEIREIPEFHMFGMQITADELAAKRDASKADGVKNNSSRNRTDKRGEFLKAEHAVYGKGELFHPKEKIPQTAKIVKLYDYPIIEAGGAAGAATTTDNDDD